MYKHMHERSISLCIGSVLSFRVAQPPMADSAMSGGSHGTRWKWVHMRQNGTLRPDSYVMLGFIRVEEGMVWRVAFHSGMDVNPSWTPFHGG